MDKVRCTNHHGRGSAKHVTHAGFDAPHIDKRKSKHNLYWAWDSKGSVRGSGSIDLQAAEMRYYEQTLSAGLAIQNEKHKARRQYGRIRTMAEIYTSKPPEESLLYIGSKESALGDVSPQMLWQCVAQYIKWEQAYSKRHNMFYVPLSLGLHADEEGQIHVHERGIYQYKDGDGNWKLGQSAALEAAGIPLPDAGKPRSKDNNRKISWDALRREKWLDIVASHGFDVIREPEKNRPHLGLEAWQGWQDAMADIEADAIALNSQKNDLEGRERELEARESAQKAQEALLQQKLDILDAVAKEAYQRALQQRVAEERSKQAEEELLEPVKRSRKRAGKRSPAEPSPDFLS